MQDQQSVTGTPARPTIAYKNSGGLSIRTTTESPRQVYGIGGAMVSSDLAMEAVGSEKEPRVPQSRRAMHC